MDKKTLESRLREELDDLDIYEKDALDTIYGLEAATPEVDKVRLAKDFTLLRDHATRLHAELRDRTNAGYAKLFAECSE